MKKSSIAGKIRSYISTHKKTAWLAVIVLAGAGVWIYRSSTAATSAPQYTLAMARIGSITQTVSGSGQVSASNQTDIQAQVSGTVKSINASVGQAVHTGDLIATIDSSNAAITLENARLSLAKLTQPAKQTDVSSSQSNISKSYDDAFNAASSIYLDLPSIVSNLKDMLYGTSGFLSDQRATSLSQTGRTYRDAAGKEYDAAVAKYTRSLQEFKSVTRTSATSSIDAMLSDTYDTIRAFSQTLSDTQSAVSFITSTQSDYHPNEAAAANANVTSWSTQANGDLSSLGSARNSIISAQNSYANLIAGSDSLDIQSAKLNLAQAEKTYSNYFIRAPYDGMIGRIPVSVYGQAGSGTTIATIIGNQKIATISLNEVDAAKVKAGQPVSITFDAIDGLNATGTVSQIDLVGTVTQGVVSYSVKILINTSDERIKPGMSVNTSIITDQESGALVVPSTAIKTANGRSYVLVIDSPLGSSTPAARFGRGSATSTAEFGTAAGSRYYGTGTASSTDAASSTATTTARTGGFRRNGAIQIPTITSSETPRQVFVTVGVSDDTNTQILSGLAMGQFVVTKTTASGAATSAAAPSILNSIGARGGAGAGGGAVRRVGN